jgi:hypothetical protein
MTITPQSTVSTDSSLKVALSRVKIEGEYFYQITNSDTLRPFFMSIVSDSNHWMFIASNGGLTAGRKNAEYALFPYYTEDKVTESFETTGSKTLFRVYKDDKVHVWEPFSIRSDGFYNTTRNVYKSVYGNRILFEEINHDLQLSFRYMWSTSNMFGFVRRSFLTNLSDDETKVSLIDGIQNVLPQGVGSDLQNSTSNLVDAYKRTELEPESGLGIFALSAIIVDKAEPSEALKANVAWSIGLEEPTYLLSTLQLKNFRKGLPLQQETDVKAEKGAYFVHKDVLLGSQEEKEWMVLADVNKGPVDVTAISEKIKNEKNLREQVLKNERLGTQRLIELNASSDGLQLSADKFRDSRHFSNSLFNIMRGGVFDYNYQIEKWDLKNYLRKANKNAYAKNKASLDHLPEEFTYFELHETANAASDQDFKRLCLEYLPLKFSRRHGDPSRPWNQFSINTRSEIDGSKILDYEGNWRDIFQNWEALAQSFPSFSESMVHKFLNATTFEGYNPYRVTKDGFDWETIEPDNPWSYIGYWGDHQIIYLLKLLELSEYHFPNTWRSFFEEECFVYANVPYKIKSYQEILENPKDTIEFDEELDAKIRERREALGSDAALLSDENGSVYHVNYIEKVLAMVLAKVSNFIPGAGIWMNTQRPEWNDANNALVGNGVSMVTLFYLRRFLLFFRNQIEGLTEERVPVSNELIIFYKNVRGTFEEHRSLLDKDLSDKDRKTILDAIGEAGSDYREHIYKQGFWGEKRTVSYGGIRRFIDYTLEFIDHTIRSNKRSDNMYHAYNLMTVKNEDEISISRLSEMLEGQVAALSSGFLSSHDAVKLLDGLKSSALFREDQYSYLLYPNKELPGFLEKNIIPKKDLEGIPSLLSFVDSGNRRIAVKDSLGTYHFSGEFKNASDLRVALNDLKEEGNGPFTASEEKEILQLFEKVFNHKAFTGRSGTFFGYEGLGSIYWHMVSKLQLAVQEVCLQAIREEAGPQTVGRLLDHYYEINEGIGVHKSPSLYGAFPTDPYSHTPAGKGAQQPGMTGQVKEDVLSRFGELGAFVNEGTLMFNPCLLRKNEFIKKPRTLTYVDVHKNHIKLHLNIGELCFTYCQVPVVYKLSEERRILVYLADGTTVELEGISLGQDLSRELFERTDKIRKIEVMVMEKDLK